MTNSTANSRRDFLRVVAGTTLATATISKSTRLFAESSSRDIESSTHKSHKLRFYNLHTKQSLDVAYKVNGKYDQKNLMRLNYLLRDHRQNEAIIMDPKLFDQLWDLQQHVGGNGIYEIVSGYRSPTTNSMLRKSSSSVASRSYHMQGRAVDTRLRGVSLKTLRDVALSKKAGGVGYYPASQFVHLDTGPARNWNSI